MSREIDSVAADLFDKVRSRFTDVSLGNEKAKSEQDPTKVRFFNFDFTTDSMDSNATKYGNVTISLVDETTLKVYYPTAITHDMDTEVKREWYEFLRGLRKFAKRNLLKFDTRDIAKSNLALQDIKQQSKADDVATTDDMPSPVTESKMYGTSRNSYIDIDECRLLIKHDGIVDDQIHGARSRKIREIFVETNRGERFLLDFTNLHGAKAMARHINEGGDIHDDIGESICNMVKEMASMKHFVRSMRERTFEDGETDAMVKSAVGHYTKLKNTLRHLVNKRHYQEFTETYTPESAIEDEVDVDALRERFVKKIYDDRFNDALPIVYKVHQRSKMAENQLGSELEEWADTVIETTYATPDNSSKLEALQELMNSPLTASTALDKLEGLIGDDDLEEAIRHFAVGTGAQGPDADCRPLVKTWMHEHKPELLEKISFGNNNVDNAATNYVAPISPEISGQQQYGVTGMDDPVTENDDLSFLRSLAGLKKKL